MELLVLQGVRYILMVLGVCLLVVGGLLLLWFGLLVQQIIQSPEEVALIEYIAARVGAEGPLLVGEIAGDDFQLELSETLRSFGFFFLGLVALSIFSGIIKALVVAGVDILKSAIAMEIPAAPVSNDKRADVNWHRPSP